MVGTATSSAPKRGRSWRKFICASTSSVQYLARVRILSFTEPAIVRYEHLRSLKLNISKMDLRIAAIALEENAVVVTRNVRDFQRIPSLAIEDWSQ